jgi:hypothetical protein
MNQIQANKYTIEIISDYIDLLNKIYCYIPLIHKDDILELINKCSNINNLTDDIPDECYDPIQCTLIKDPCMIPNINSIFDKSTILKHLMTENTNPYTRENLTIKIFEEYNKTETIKTIIDEYNKKYYKYII